MGAHARGGLFTESVVANMCEAIDTTEYFGMASELKYRTEQTLFQTLLRVQLRGQKSNPAASSVPFTPQAFMKTKKR